MKRVLILAALLLGLVAGAGPAAAEPAGPKGKPGVIADFTLTDVCPFDVELVATGKGKTIDLPGDRVILPSPGLKVTFTNAVTRESVSYVATGTIRQQTLANGDVVSTVTGRNTLINDSESDRPGIYLVVGTFHFTLDEDGNEVEVFNLDGPGRVTDVCAILA